jgi:large subunit ribosomal protein L3
MKLSGFFGFKVGTTQLFEESSRNVVPASAVSFGVWYALQTKTKGIDGYDALKVGTPRKRYLASEFDQSWVKNLSKFFLHVREVKIASVSGDVFAVGHKLSVDDFSLDPGRKVDVTGVSRSLGFQGVVKRHGFSGGDRSHGCRFGRIPGSIGCIRGSEGEVFKGKKLPGRAGGKSVTVKGLKVVSVEADSGVLFVKGAVPGKKGSLLRLRLA